MNETNQGRRPATPIKRKWMVVVEAVLVYASDAMVVGAGLLRGLNLILSGHSLTITAGSVWLATRIAIWVVHSMVGARGDRPLPASYRRIELAVLVVHLISSAVLVGVFLVYGETYKPSEN